MSTIRARQQAALTTRRHPSAPPTRFAPAFAGSRPDAPTPAPAGPPVYFSTVTVNGGRVDIVLANADPLIVIQAITMDWGDGTPRQAAGGFALNHTYQERGVYLMRAIARSTAGQTSVNGYQVQVLTSIPDPVADFTITPANPTSADLITLDGSSSTPAEHIDRYIWHQLVPTDANSYDQPWIVGPLPAGAAVWELVVRLHDGRESARRQRGVAITAAEER